MPATLAEMTPEEFQRLLETTVERKLREVLGLADEGGPLRDEVRERLVRQQAEVAAGARGAPLEDAMRALDLT